MAWIFNMIHSRPCPRIEIWQTFPGPLCANIIISFESKMRVQMCSLEKRDTRYGCKSSTILDGRQTNGGTCATYMHNQERKRTKTKDLSSRHIEFLLVPLPNELAWDTFNNRRKRKETVIILSLKIPKILRNTRKNLRASMEKSLDFPDPLFFHLSTRYDRNNDSVDKVG